VERRCRGAVRAPVAFSTATSYVPSKPPFLLDGGTQVALRNWPPSMKLGYRGQAADHAVVFGDSGFIPSTTIYAPRTWRPAGRQFVFASNMEGSTTGIEMWGTWQARAGWRLNAGLTAPGANGCT